MTVMKKKIRGFAFVGNPLAVRHKIPFIISEGVVFRKPTKTQLRLVKFYLDGLSGYIPTRSPFENDLPISKKGQMEDETYNEQEIEPLNVEDWRYYVVTFEGGRITLEAGSSIVNDLRCASSLSRVSLRLNPIWVYGGTMSKFTEDWEYYTNAAFDHVVDMIDESDLSALSMLYQEFCSVSKSHPDIVRSIRMYNALPKFHGYNELLSLGLFSIIESLITHNPSGEYDSLGHQIKHKIPLLGRRLDEPIDYSCFKKAEQQSIWSKLYDYRSRVAHGGYLDFSGRLQILKDSYTIQRFLESVLRALLRHALREPDLYVDLRDC